MANKEITLEPMFESMDIEKEQKVALQEAFDKAVVKKTTDLMETYVEEQLTERTEALEEEYKEKVDSLTESLDGYLDTVVEDFISENAASYESQIEEERVKSLLEMFDKMTTVAGIDMLKIQEAKEIDARDNDPQVKLDEAEDKISELAEKLVEAKRESNKHLQLGIIAETSEDLSILEAAKFEKLAKMIPFERSAVYLEKLETIKEQIMDSRSDDYIPSAELPKSAFRQPEAVSTTDALDYSRYV